MLFAAALFALLCAGVPAVLFCVNLRLYQPPPRLSDQALPAVSVLIPARNEESSIAAAVGSILASRGIDFEVIVMDDSSTDRTAAIVSELRLEDPRVRLATALPLPAGWNGKQHACWQLAQLAKNPILCFVDADVRLSPDALSRMAIFLVRTQSGLVSGFPRQLTGTFLEWLLLPLIHFVLLGFLPLARMRAGTDPAVAAGCGQFLMATRDAYQASGGHSQIKATMHDGLLLPRLFRKQGFHTDLADITDLATCRMYSTAHQVWFGLAKNATEGIASPGRIVPISVILFAGQVLPFLFGIFLLAHRASWAIRFCALAAVCAAWLPRMLAVGRFRQDWRGAALHSFGVLTLLAVQWYALARKLMGRAVTWRDRAYAEH